MINRYIGACQEVHNHDALFELGNNIRENPMSRILYQMSYQMEDRQREQKYITKEILNKHNVN